MPDLHDLLTEAVPPRTPGFDESDVRSRVARRQRRSQQAMAGIIALVVVGASAGILTLRGSDRVSIAGPPPTVGAGTPDDGPRGDIAFAVVAANARLVVERAGADDVVVVPVDPLGSSAVTLLGSVDGTAVEVRAGSHSEVEGGFLLSGSSEDGGPAIGPHTLTPAGSDELLAVVACGATAWSARTVDPADSAADGGALLIAFLNRLDDDPECDLGVEDGGADQPGEGPAPVQPTATPSPSSPEGAAPAADDPTPSADRLLESIGRAEVVAGVPTVEREGDRTTIQVELAAEDGLRPVVDLLVDEDHPLVDRPAPTAQTPLVLVGGGEAAVLDDDSLAMSCPHPLEVSVLVTGASGTAGPDAAGGSSRDEVPRVADMAQLAGTVFDAIGCQPAPPPTTVVEPQPGGDPVERSAPIREARLAAVRAQLGVEGCCGEPAHGSAEVASGLIWEDVEVRLYATAPRPVPELRVWLVPLAGGQADGGDPDDGLPQITFDCGDTRYSLLHDSPREDVHVRAAEALVRALDCTPAPPG